MSSVGSDGPSMAVEDMTSWEGGGGGKLCVMFRTRRNFMNIKSYFVIFFLSYEPLLHFLFFMGRGDDL